MHSVAQTHAFVAQAKAAGMTDAEIDALAAKIVAEVSKRTGATLRS